MGAELRGEKGCRRPSSALAVNVCSLSLSSLGRTLFPHSTLSVAAPTPLALRHGLGPGLAARVARGLAAAAARDPLLALTLVARGSRLSRARCSCPHSLTVLAHSRTDPHTHNQQRVSTHPSTRASRTAASDSLVSTRPHRLAPRARQQPRTGTPRSHSGTLTRQTADDPRRPQTHRRDPARLPPPERFIPSPNNFGPQSLSLSLRPPLLALPTIQSATRSATQALRRSPVTQPPRLALALCPRRPLSHSSRTAMPAARSFAPSQPLTGGPEPSQIGTKELLIERALTRLRSIPHDLEKYTFLASLRCRNPDVFYGLVGGNMKECCVRLPLFFSPPFLPGGFRAEWRRNPPFPEPRATQALGSWLGV